MIRQVVQSTLRAMSKDPLGNESATLRVALFAGAQEIGAQAAALSGLGLDLYGGEHTLAGLRRVDRTMGTSLTVMAITTRRSIVGGYATGPRGLNETGFAIEHDEITGLEAEHPTLRARLTLHTVRGNCPLTNFYDMCGELEACFRALLVHPAGARAEPRTEPFTATTDDPSGAIGARAQLWSADVEAAELLTRIDAHVRSGALTIDAARDSTARTVLWHRSRLCGPASYGPANLSPLCADDFAAVLTSILGAPLDYHQPQLGLHAMDFRVLPSHALSPSMVLTKEIPPTFHQGLGRVLGNVIAPKPDLTTIRVVYGDVAGGTRYELFADEVTPLALAEALTAHRFHQLVTASAHPILARRVDVGWTRRHAELWA